MKLFLLLLCLLSVSSYAQPTQITWTDAGAPSAQCAVAGNSAVDIAYGYPTTYRCKDGAGAVAGLAVSTPSCPEGFEADFSKLICVPSESESYGLNKALFNLVVCFTLAAAAIAGYRDGRKA